MTQNREKFLVGSYSLFSLVTHNNERSKNVKVTCQNLKRVTRIMPSSIKLIADSGATKAEWCLIENGKSKTVFTQGISPYFLTVEQIRDILLKELKPKLRSSEPTEIYYYGTGCARPENGEPCYLFCTDCNWWRIGIVWVL